MAQLTLKNVYKRYDDNEKRLFGKKKALNDYAVKDVSFTCPDLLHDNANITLVRTTA
ncbi:hypothetical protein FACS189494_11060 [Spirochaetia bacterium]|nr:hypothetical protein FACS189494_11060 [Spirochaetia bacterium]